jgi:hypothetical protein
MAGMILINSGRHSEPGEESLRYSTWQGSFLLFVVRMTFVVGALESHGETS